jgi:3-phosphoshikimate 1-carboxyvinyltransferase
VLLLAALADGTTEVRDLLHSDDTDRMLDALRTLGISIESSGDNAYRVEGCGGAFPVKDAGLFLGNAGTAFRPLTAALAFSNGCYKLTGVARMHERPVGDLVNALRQLGANIAYLGNEGFPPLQINQAVPAGDTVQIRGDVSSQFLTGLLMALPLTGQTVKVEVLGELISKPYIEITLAMMARFGVVVERQGWQRFIVFGGQRYKSPGTIYVEGDASSASYFLAAGAIGGGPLRVEGVGRDSIQGDVRFADALALMGAQINMGDNWIEASAPLNGTLKAIELDCNHIPDAAMTLAVAALYAQGTTVLRNIASWRVKETDRIVAMATELRKLGATVEEGEDYIRITPPHSVPGTPNSGINTYDDHRMAMCFSLAAFASGIRINDPDCVGKTFPDYFVSLARVTQPVPVIAIDGPSASGKGTVAQRVAVQLNFHYLDSGALYRVLALAATREEIALDDEQSLADLAANMDVVFKDEQIWLDGVLTGDALRGELCAAGASKVAALPMVRAALLKKQHDFRRAPGLVTDGRDMGSVVFPDALLKIFLTAGSEERANRRYKQLKEKGMDVNMHTLLQDIRMRDERDSQRGVAPLQQFPDASLLDTTGLAIDQAVEWVLAAYQEKCKTQ